MSNELKCNCQHCNGHIAFPSEMAGQSINCPHCQLETLLFMPPAAVAPTQPPPTRKNPNPVGLLASVIAITACIVVVVLLIRSQKQVEQSKLTNLKPVVGAFGWKLGDKLPDQLKNEVKDGSYSFTPSEKTLPFEDYTLRLTDDGSIYCIEANGHTPDGDSDAYKKALISLLSEKYGRRPKESGGLPRVGENCYFGSDEQTAHLNIYNEHLFTLEYYDRNLQRIAYAEDEARRKKDENDKKAALSKGL